MLPHIDFYESCSLQSFFRAECGGLYLPDDRLCVFAKSPEVLKYRPITKFMSRNEVLSKDFQRKLHDWNNAGYNIYFSVCTLRPDAKSRQSKDMLMPRAVWADFDNPSLAIDAFLHGNGWADIPTPDWIITTSDGRYQCYWRLLPDDSRSIIEICAEVRRIAVATGADEKVADVARVLRMPGFANTKPERGAWKCTAYRRRDDKPIKLPNCPLFNDIERWNRSMWLSAGAALRKVHGERGIKLWMELSATDEAKWPGEEAARNELAEYKAPARCETLGCLRSECRGLNGIDCLRRVNNNGGN
ncbi:MAG: DNA-primase RepB domain-containing protein [Synergistaceae bacterium]|nr:DNA-primase RepB domain-containing protein [Synergistaceae bacterium]